MPTNEPHTGRASREQLIELWRLLLSALIQELRSDKPVRASMYEVARQFLKDNGVSAEVANAMAARSALQDLKDRSGDAPEDFFTVPFPTVEQ